MSMMSHQEEVQLELMQMQSLDSQLNLGFTCCISAARKTMKCLCVNNLRFPRMLLLIRHAFCFLWKEDYHFISDSTKCKEKFA